MDTVCVSCIRVRVWNVYERVLWIKFKEKIKISIGKCPDSRILWNNVRNKEHFNCVWNLHQCVTWKLVQEFSESFKHC